MIEWKENLYLDERMSKGARREQAVRLAEEKKPALMPAFGIFLAQNPENLFEIISLNEFLQRGYRNRIYRCIGLAADRESAGELVGEMIAEAYRKTGGVPGREYFEQAAPGEKF